MRQHIEQEIPAIVGKYFENTTAANVTLSKEGTSFRTDIAVHVGKGIMVQAHALTHDPYGSFEAAAEHVGKRLRRYKRRLRDHHRGRSREDTLAAAQYVLAAEIDPGPESDEHLEPEQPVIIAEMETEIEALTVGEAVMQMDLANRSALMFRNRAHGGLNMVYTRRDGNIGWIDPESGKR